MTVIGKDSILGLLLMAMLPTAAFAHPNGTSLVDVVIGLDSVVVRADVNKDDMLNAVSSKPSSEMTPEDYRELNFKIAHYFKSRLNIEFDGQGASNPRVVCWSKDTTNPGQLMDSAAIQDTTLVMKLAWSIPGDTRRLGVNIYFFEEFGIQALSHVRAYWRGKMVAREFLTIDDRMLIKLDPDSLLAAAGKLEGPELPARAASGRFKGGLAAGFSAWFTRGLAAMVLLAALMATVPKEGVGASLPALVFGPAVGLVFGTLGTRTLVSEPTGGVLAGLELAMLGGLLAVGFRGSTLFTAVAAVLGILTAVQFNALSALFEARNFTPSLWGAATGLLAGMAVFPALPIFVGRRFFARPLEALAGSKAIGPLLIALGAALGLLSWFSA